MSKIKCLKCNEILESTYRHDFKMCKCDNQSYVDGGSDYMRVGGMDLSLIVTWNNDKQEFNAPSVDEIKEEKIENISYHDFLIQQGYKFYNNQNKDFKNYNLYQKRIDNKIVSDTNDKLFINVKDYNLVISAPIEGHFFEIEIVLDKYNTWWKLQSYGLPEVDLKLNLDLIEKQLLKFVNTF